MTVGVWPGKRSPFLKWAKWLLALLLLCVAPLLTQTSAQRTAILPGASFDVLHYDAQVEPDIANKTVSGKVLIRLVALTAKLDAIEFDCGNLTVDAVREGRAAQKFAQRDRRLSIALARPASVNETREIEILYHGAPRFGIRFFPNRSQVYTVFSTSQWLVCVDAPNDRATLRLNLILPAGLTPVANGRLIAQHSLPNHKTVYEWQQETPVPTYIFGFAAGGFHTVSEMYGGVELRYLAAQYSDDELRRIFHDTTDMMRFYEGCAGVKYSGKTYTQVLAAGGVEQEVSGFTLLRENYGRDVLADERDLWLGAHELAHQWWGNMVTCRDWTHFWLNEGMATFMAAAYKEHRFGRDEYLREIEASRIDYEKVRDAGKDRSLVFPDWSHPTREDRTLVYQKGAYVLHLLRQELGERDFWAGIRQYTRAYFGKSVTTTDFQTAMEQASGKSLKDFFAQWVYLTQR
jgi:aminopeptidase N